MTFGRTTIGRVTFRKMDVITFKRATMNEMALDIIALDRMTLAIFLLKPSRCVI